MAATAPCAFNHCAGSAVETGGTVAGYAIAGKTEHSVNHRVTSAAITPNFKKWRL
jgi:hypothetical protein